MRNIDPVLQEIDSDKDTQAILSELANDAFNNNYFLISTPSSNNKLFQSAIARISKYVEDNKKLFLNEKAVSLSARINYPLILSVSNGKLPAIAKYLTINFAEEKQKSIDDYIRELFDPSSYIAQNFSLKLNKEHLFCISDNPDIELLNHAINLNNGSMIFLHQFLRRNFSSNFVDTPSVIGKAIDNDNKVEIRIDPFRIGDIDRYSEIHERDYWHGPRFSNKLLEDANYKEKITKHFVPENIPVLKKYVTFFRSSMMSKGLRQFFIEEYLPENQIVSTDKYAIQKFAHFVYDQTRHTFEHVDCAVRIFDKNEYGTIFNKIKAGATPETQIGKRFKLIKISRYPSLELIQDLLYAFFRENPNIIEYFCNIATTAEALEYVGNQ